MPLLKIQTNQTISEPSRYNLLQQASATIAELLGKPERYVMVSLEPNPHMLFAGTAEPLAYLELKSIGLPQEHTRELSASLCRLMTEHLGIPPDRVYIEFADAPRPLWGWNSGTF